MEKITITYSISRTVALTEGRSEFGTNTYTPTDTELQFLTLDERKYLDTLNLESKQFALKTGAPPTWPNIADSIRESYKNNLQSIATENARREDLILKCLSTPIDKWFFLGGYCADKYISISIPEYDVRNNSWGYSDQRIVDHIKALEPELQKCQVEINADNERIKKQTEAENIAKQKAKEEIAAKKQEAIQNINQWCIEHGPEHLKRGAEEGYSIIGSAIGWIAQNICDSVDCLDSIVIREGTSLWENFEWEERQSPNEKAFNDYDYLKNAISHLNYPSSINIELQRIMRVTKENEYSEKDEYTGLVVMLSHLACATRVVIINLE